jgi:uncharacterized C2H2 Zn-finger protein
MGERYVELERLKQRPSVFLGPDGKIIDPGPPPQSLYGYGGRKEEEMTHFPCPDCKRIFKKARGVLRHAMRFHDVDLPSAKAMMKQSKKMAYVKRINIIKVRKIETGINY